MNGLGWPKGDTAGCTQLRILGSQSAILIVELSDGVFKTSSPHLLPISRGLCSNSIFHLSPLHLLISTEVRETFSLPCLLSPNSCSS